MKILYFEDSDTALVELSCAPVVETRELSEDVYLDLDAHGSIVSITIELASTRGDMSKLSFFRLPRRLTTISCTQRRPVRRVLLAAARNPFKDDDNDYGDSNAATIASTS